MFIAQGNALGSPSPRPKSPTLDGSAMCFYTDRKNSMSTRSLIAGPLNKPTPTHRGRRKKCVWLTQGRVPLAINIKRLRRFDCAHYARSFRSFSSLHSVLR